MLYIGIIIVLLVVLPISRALRFNPPKDIKLETVKHELNQDLILENFISMLKCKTVSLPDEALMDEGEFERFRELLVKRYPLIHNALTRKLISPRGIVYHWKGISPKDPMVLMSHYDVVPADNELWQIDPFDAQVIDGEVWGRGTLDTKGTLLAIMESVEYLLAKGFVPPRDIYLSFGGDEEIGGKSTHFIVDSFAKKNIKPGLVLDEGGAIVSNVFPGVSGMVACIGTGEKGYMDVDLEITGKGGHSSAPPKHTLAGEMAKAIVKLEQKPFPPRLTKPVIELFDTLGRHSSFGLKLIFANLWLFEPLLKIILRRMGGQMDAMIRTTFAVTKLEGSDSYNVMPPRVRAGVNLRLLNGDTGEGAKNLLHFKTGNPKIKATIRGLREASAVSRTDSEGYGVLKDSIKQSFDNVIVSPYLTMAGTDSQYYCRISDCVYRFSPFALSKDQLAMNHGHNERVGIKDLLRAVEFYINLIENYGKG